MRKVAEFSAAVVLAAACLGLPANAARAGGVPDEKVCRDPQALAAAEPAVQGGCIALNRTKGNCPACHQIAGATSGNIAPPLVFIADRFPDKARLRAQVQDPRRFNPRTVMPPFGAHHILTPDEIDKVLAFLLTL